MDWLGCDRTSSDRERNEDVIEMAEPRLVCEEQTRHSEKVYVCKLEDIHEGMIILPEFSDFLIYGREGRCRAIGGREPEISECKDVLNGIISFNYGMTVNDIEEIMDKNEE